MNELLSKYNQSVIDEKFATDKCKEIHEQIQDVNNLRVSDKLILNYNSSDKQFMFGLSVIKQWTECSKELGINIEKMHEDNLPTQFDIIKLHKLGKEYNEWMDYAEELHCYKCDLYNLLSKEDYASLLKVPKKPE